jgi:hypothetical protein
MVACTCTGNDHCISRGQRCGWKEIAGSRDQGTFWEWAAYFFTHRLEAAQMITLTLMVALYFLPTIVASHRGHRVGGILVLNTLFGWTGIGWAALLMWALLSAPRYLVYAGLPFAGDYRYARCGGSPRW